MRTSHLTAAEVNALPPLVSLASYGFGHTELTQKPLLKRLRAYGWYFVCQFKKNRRFEGRPLVRYLQQPYWQATGSLAGDIKVFVVRYRRKYYATNRLSLSATEVRALYRKRQEVEEVIRVVKSQVSLEGCQAGYQRAFATSPRPGEGVQEHHMALCGARASRLRGHMEPTQATTHPPRTTGPRACSGARQKGRVRSAHGKILD